MVDLMRSSSVVWVCSYWEPTNDKPALSKLTTLIILAYYTRNKTYKTYWSGVGSAHTVILFERLSVTGALSTGDAYVSL